MHADRESSGAHKVTLPNISMTTKRQNSSRVVAG